MTTSTVGTSDSSSALDRASLIKMSSMAASPMTAASLPRFSPRSSLGRTTLPARFLRRTDEDKASLRKLMVSCIDNALEEIGCLPDDDFASPVVKSTTSRSIPTAAELYGHDPAEPSPSSSSFAMPSAEDLYGPASPDAQPDLGYGDCAPAQKSRYQRRNSVTKFSLSAVLNQVQSQDREQHLKEKAARLMAASGGLSEHLRHLYGKRDERPMKMAGHVRPITAEGPASKRRRSVL